MFSGIYKLIDLLLKLFHIGTAVYYKHKSDKREKQVEIIKDKESSEEDKLRAIRDLSK